jgi:hypothetical protein
VQWGDFEVNWDLQQAGIETEFLAGRLGKSEYERLKFACSREISEFQMYFRIRSLPPFLAWARVAHRSLQQTVPIRIAESFLVVFDTTCAEDACRITYFYRTPQQFRALLLALLHGLEEIPLSRRSGTCCRRWPAATA